MKKKDLPLLILKIFEKFVNLKDKRFIIKKDDNLLLNIEDIDKDSDFYFRVEQYQIDNSKVALLINRKPTSNIKNQPTREWYQSTDIDRIFNSWLEILTEYETTPSFFDDPIVENFKEEYFAEFEIIDEDSYKNPLKINQILLLDNYLDYIDKKINNYKTKNNEIQIIEIQEDINDLRKNISTTPRAYVGDKLSKIWAKISKQGPKLIKDLIIEGVKEVMKITIKDFFEGRLLN